VETDVKLLLSKYLEKDSNQLQALKTVMYKLFILKMSAQCLHRGEENMGNEQQADMSYYKPLFIQKQSKTKYNIRFG